MTRLHKAPHGAGSHSNTVTAPPPTALTQAPKSLEELATLASRDAHNNWQAGYSLAQWARFLNQLASEGKVYQQEEDYDLAYLRYATVQQLANEVLPACHYEWSTVEARTKAAIARTSDSACRALVEISHRIKARYETWQAQSHRSTLAPGSLPALTLRNTVQPSSNSMGSSHLDEDESAALASLVRTKEGKKHRFKRAFQLKGKGRNTGSPAEPESATGQLFSLEATSAPPQAAPVISKESQGLLSDWDPVRFPGQDLRESSSMHRPEKIRQSPVLVRRRPATRDQPARQATSPSPLPLPGEDGDDLGLPGIEYLGAGASQRNSTAYTDLFANSGRWDPGDFRKEHPKSQLSSYATGTMPGSIHSAGSISAHSVSHSTRSDQSVRSAPAQYYSTVPTYPASSSMSAPPQPPIPPSLPPPRSRLPPAPQNLSRAPSRLTTHHQQQQGYSPWHSQQTPVPARLPPVAPPPGTDVVNLTRRSSSMARLPTGLSSLGVSTTGAYGLDSMSAIGEEIGRQEFMGRTEGGQPLRDLILPAQLIDRFVALASENTDKGIETCGLLLGTLSRNSFTITTLLIPKQQGTPDTCTTTHEEEQFAFQDERELMTLGWIHTHPTQSCFMSSLDLHTHASYQVMLAEAVAIVCAPNYDPSFGIFRMTDPPGLETIVRCDVKGLFHPHPDLPIYTDVDQSFGHCRMRNVPFESVDLRNVRGTRK